MARQLNSTQFSGTQTEPGAVINNVPVRNVTQNPVVITVIIGGVIKLLEKWGQINYLQSLFPSLNAVWAALVSDVLIYIVMAVLIFYFELRQNFLTTTKS